MGAPVAAQKAEHLSSGATRSECKQSLSTALDVGGLFLVSKKDSAVVLGTGDTADFVCFRRLERRNRLLGKRGNQRKLAYSSSVRARF